MLLEFELELLLWFELELLLELELWFELELLLWFELEFVLEFELELELWFELEPDRPGWARRRLMVRWFATTRARHQSIDFPSIFRSTVTTRAGADAFSEPEGALAELRAALR